MRFTISQLSSPIGRPILNVQIYIVDEHLRQVPVGVPGELCVAGVALARGYLNQPALTAEKFVPDPFGGRSGGRLYRTGDLARYLPDGNIEFLGRIDTQVKLRGFRIELGEVEAVLREHSAVREAVVALREDVAGDKRLTAYLTFHHQEHPDGDELRAFLKEKLPDYMLPSAFITLSAIPLTQNGKVDRSALPAPAQKRQDRILPSTPLEEVLAGIWAQVLGIDQVGINENFFELGGHSLTATQVVARIREIFEIDLPLREFFEGPTIAELARGLRRGSTGKSRSDRVARLLTQVVALPEEEASSILKSRNHPR